MTIAADIVEALQRSERTHQAIVAEVERARAENGALKRKIADLERDLADLAAKAVNVVEPSIVQPLLNELARVVAEGYTVISPMRASGPRRVEAESPSAPAARIDPVRFSARGWR